MVSLHCTARILAIVSGGPRPHCSFRQHKAQWRSGLWRKNRPEAVLSIRMFLRTVASSPYMNGARRFWPIERLGVEFEEFGQRAVGFIQDAQEYRRATSLNAGGSFMLDLARGPICKIWMVQCHGLWSFLKCKAIWSSRLRQFRH